MIVRHGTQPTYVAARQFGARLAGSSQRREAEQALAAVVELPDAFRAMECGR
jgi:hypothetical protein